ncbi:Elongator complex protein 5 [Macleaya cordata]|uniref:Elongator complex protein 5 n=1 Tax=Macleaya cordata TaxID=56857 RepID=A0A200Q3D3_MACCD|nr:Elongator complex protein 5 [Macleaya cordata]
MAETICRALRDGVLAGEHAPALTIKDSIPSPFGFDAFTHFLCSLSSNIVAGKSQSQGLVLVAFTKSPSFYFDLLKRRGIDVSSSNKWFRILDCYSDPLGWKDGVRVSPQSSSSICKDVRNLDLLFSSVLELGKGMVGQGKVRFSVAIDSVTVMLRHASLSCVAGLINNLRSHEQVSCVFWLIHSDLHEVKTIAVLEYMSSMVASLEPMTLSVNGQRSNSGSLFSLEQYSRKGKFHLRLKRRNGRVKVMCEEFDVEQAGIKFIVGSSANEIVNQSLLPKVVQFNLQLSEKERSDRENVVLPFEHQGNGKTVEIYDGRRSLSESTTDLTTTSVSFTEKLHTEEADQVGKGEIHYVRDSDDDELPDSDEDPDDDLDI